MHYIFRTLWESGVAVERFFATPYPYRSVDADTMLERFSVITAGISYEGDIETFFSWLHEAGIPLLPEERGDSFPVIGAGGALTYINPLALSAVCDFIVLGDALDVMKEIAGVIRAYGAHGDRKRLWTELADLPSVLVPPVDLNNGKLRGKKKIDVSQPLSADYPMCSAWVTPESAFGDTLLLELQRGCVRNCSYCTLPGCFGKMRQRKLPEIEAPLRSLLEKIEVEQVGLVTPEAGDYYALDELLDLLQEEGKGVSFASLRVDRLSEKMLEALTSSGRHSVTIAPETANEELRFSFGKKFTDELIFEKLELARSFGVDQVKLYFMIGLPGEEDEDVAAIADFCRRIVERTDQNLIVSVGPFVPKPGTVWQNETFLSQAEIRKKYDILGKEIRKFGRKAPQLRLTSAKEAEREFQLAWAGYQESLLLAKNVENGKKTRFVGSSRNETLLELNCLY